MSPRPQMHFATCGILTISLTRSSGSPVLHSPSSRARASLSRRPATSHPATQTRKLMRRCLAHRLDADDSDARTGGLVDNVDGAPVPSAAAFAVEHVSAPASGSTGSEDGLVEEPLEARAAAPIEVEQPPPPSEAAQAYKMKRYRFKRLPCLHEWVGEIVVGPWRCSVCGKAVASGVQAVGVRCDLPGCAAVHCSACHRRLLALVHEPSPEAPPAVEHC